jgi:hypothetical protein
MCDMGIGYGFLWMDRQLSYIEHGFSKYQLHDRPVMYSIDPVHNCQAILLI